MSPTRSCRGPHRPIGDGKVWVVPVEYLTRIRTAELGAEAL